MWSIPVDESLYEMVIKYVKHSYWCKFIWNGDKKYVKHSYWLKLIQGACKILCENLLLYDKNFIFIKIELKVSITGKFYSNYSRAFTQEFETRNTRMQSDLYEETANFWECCCTLAL